jgi:HNH endonuclease
MIKLTQKDRARFEKFILIDDETGCWLFMGCRHPRTGHGQFRVGGRKGKQEYAHRVAYTLYVGPIPEGKVLDHITECKYTYCCNPDHLEPCTSLENSLRGAERGNGWKVKKHPVDIDEEEYNEYAKAVLEGMKC